MSSDYFHGVYAADTSIAGSLQIAENIAEVLRTHQLAGDPDARWCLDQNDVRPIEADQTGSPARNAGFTFRSSQTQEHHVTVAKCVVGGSGAAEAQAWANFTIVSGPDYRLIHVGDLGPGVQVLEPPMASGQEVADFEPELPDNARRGWDHMAFGVTTFPASEGCTAPVCELDWFVPPMDPKTGEPLPARDDGFTGLWRTALFVHSMPYDWAENSRSEMVLPEGQFKSDLWEALGGSAYEMGFAW